MVTAGKSISLAWRSSSFVTCGCDL